jgi:hypothetical protein
MADHDIRMKALAILKQRLRSTTEKDAPTEVPPPDLLMDAFRAKISQPPDPVEHKDTQPPKKKCRHVHTKNCHHSHSKASKPVEYKKMPFGRDNPCCARNCWLPGTFQDLQISTWRSAAEDHGPKTKHRAKFARAVMPSMLMHDGKTCCVNFVVWVFAVNKKALYHTPQVLNKRRDNSSKDISIMAWFANLKLVIDKMPDEPVWQVAAPWKKDVYEWYESDAKEYAHYLHVSRDYFNKKWPADVKLRKWVRFSKCSICQDNRKIKWDGSASREEKELATTTLLQHYKDVKHERAYALSRAQQAVERPTEFLSIAMDGTDQLPKGLPQFSVDTSSEARFTERLKVKFTIVKIHGLETRCYDHLENIAGDPNLTIEVNALIHSSVCGTLTYILVFAYCLGVTTDPQAI